MVAIVALIVVLVTLVAIRALVVFMTLVTLVAVVVLVAIVALFVMVVWRMRWWWAFFPGTWITKLEKLSLRCRGKAEDCGKHKGKSKP